MARCQSRTCGGDASSSPALLGGLRPAREANVVFEDKFADDAGGWAINQDVEVKDGSFVFKLPPDAMQSDLNVTYNVNDADICSETVWPNGDPTIARRRASVLGRGQPELSPVRRPQQRQILDRAAP